MNLLLARKKKYRNYSQDRPSIFRNRDKETYLFVLRSGKIMSFYIRDIYYIL